MTEDFEVVEEDVSPAWLYEHKHDSPPVDILLDPQQGWGTLVDVQRQNSTSSRYMVEARGSGFGVLTRFATNRVDTFRVRYRRSKALAPTEGNTLVTLTTYVERDWPSMAQDTLWGRKVDLISIPTEGTRMAILASKEEPSGSVYVPIVDVFINMSGTVCVQLEATIVDPDEEGEKAIMRSMNSNPRNRRGSWHTQRDGDMHARLRECGWLPLDEWPEGWRG